ncbi:P pilus assembly/Cpx signaling pathway, periplasmic inhibitor/zinc-resistance associated protein [Chthonomonas calidirosea]|uniref:P pilus assembly/Cpx signaling pathway,periplasmic inhibitor/zinc-resistance associated protein n=1 Tax=Chthonomonas calidirosea (strain DSM 23976 / ICMP 18418 / T49) TaxID=1303518 RepID=S0EWB8_CHTCT|nr:pilus assembly protein [Chthonomonas calidirosea]CCW34669.1 P pilus assembly/Cpx signaling pathway,periplasmic inhibitor/zinc-resistance associated protein [Chthonomonas calidirosea T49]CEK14132.1 P pilus assembly/Cpx signaling pathway, periplasmic inhibitor/zinc-resistance associated protein [Chthonomonas calidirosea]
MNRRSFRNGLAVLAFTSLALLGFAAPNARALQGQPPAAPTGQQQRPNRRQNGFLQFLNSLNLTASQKQQIQDIMKKQREQMRQLRQDTSLTPQQRRQKFMQIRKNTDAAIRKVLNADQQKKFDEWLKQQEQNWRNRQRNRNRGQQNPNPSGGNNNN